MLYALAAFVEPFDRAEYERVKAAIEARIEHCHTVRGTPLPEECETCHRRIVAGFTIARAVWNAVAGEAAESLCIECFDDAARAKHVRYTFTEVCEFPWFDTLPLPPVDAVVDDGPGKMDGASV